MDFVDLKTADAALKQHVLTLNAEHVVATSELDLARLEVLIAEADLAIARTDGRAFLLAFGPGAQNQGVNYAWVSNHYDAFLYVDRIVVGSELQGQGVGRALYQGLIDRAALTGVAVLCEVNFVPPNPGSDAFHAALGFEEVGRAETDPGKTVRYLMRKAS